MAERPGLAALAAIALSVAATAAACTQVEERVVHRQNCLVCHRPLDEAGEAHGIEDAHPWHELSCTDCHGGNGWDCDGELILVEGGDPKCDGTWRYEQLRAHVPPGDSPDYLKDLTAGELDAVDRDYLRFINPGDLRVVQDTCARCHTNVSSSVRRSLHTHGGGEIAVARFRAGAQPDPRARFGATDASDNAAPQGDPCASAIIADFRPPPVIPGTADPVNAPTVANVQDQYLVKTCLSCHVASFGENAYRGTYRSSGCTTCHMPYMEDGLSRSTDPWVDTRQPPHPVTHELQVVAPMDACNSCHYAGARIGLSYRGIREAAGPGLDPEGVATLGRELYGKGADAFIVDEDPTNSWDETPPDVHFEAGMHCVDCHTRDEVHGTNHIASQAACVSRTTCEECHGDARAVASPSPFRDNVFERDGKLFLRTKLTGLELEIPQVKDAVTPGHPRYSERAAQAMGVDDQDFSHADEVACATCHSAWMPSCYGCHVDVDLSGSQKMLTTGASVPGAVTERAGPVQLNDLVLMRDSRGKLAPSMPAERLMLSLLQLDPAPGDPQNTSPIWQDRPREATLPGDRRIAAFGQRAIVPHTTRRTSQFQACDRCHSTGDAAAPDNAALLDITHGFGSDRFLQAGCDVTNADESCDPATDQTTYRLDAVMTPAGEPLVVVGHPWPESSRVLTLEEVQRMRAIVVPAETPIPADAATNPRFPESRPPP